MPLSYHLGTREQIGTRLIFFVAGLAMASWAPLIPLAKVRFNLDDAQLGTLLLCLGLGSIVAMPLSGGLAARFGCRSVIVMAGLIALAMLPTLVLAPSASLLAASLLIFGAGIGTVDVVMNVQAVIVEKASNRSMMSGFHGLFSVGGIAGAGGVSALLALDATPLAATLGIVALALILIALAFPGLLTFGSEEDSPVTAFPRGPVVLLGILCFISFLAEGSVLDWSAVLLSSVRGLDESRAGFGYVAFATTMTLGRLTGDFVLGLMGAKRLLAAGALLAGLGYSVAALSSSWQASIAGFALVGAGASNIVPILFTAAGKQKAMPSNLAIAAVTTMGYTGLLIGPAAIGYIAKASTLPIALLTISALLVLVASSAARATRDHG